MNHYPFFQENNVILLSLTKYQFNLFVLLYVNVFESKNSHENTLLDHSIIHGNGRKTSTKE